jgi:hypothetical protein
MLLVMAFFASLFLLTDLALLAPPASLFRLVHQGLPGHLFQPLLVTGAVCLMGCGKIRQVGAVALVALLALLLGPMVTLDQWVMPLAHAWRWAATGSPDGWLAALPGTLAAAVTAIALLVGPPRKPASEQAMVACRSPDDNRSDRDCTPNGRTPRGWPFCVSSAAAWVLVGIAAALPWLGVAAQILLYGFGAGPRMLVSALLQTAALVAGLCAVRTGQERMREWGRWSTQGWGRWWTQGWGRWSTQGWGQAVLGVLPVLLLLATYFVIKLETVSWSATDENIYFYDILLFSQGKMPYRDFFFAHPPLHVMLPGVLALLTAPTFLLLKLVPVAASMVSGVFLYLAGARVSRLAGLLGAAFFLFAMEQLQASTNLTGINLTVMFVCGAFWAVVRGHHLTGGMLGGLGVLTGVYASVPVLALLPAAALGGLAPALRYGSGLLSAAVGGNALCVLLFGERFIEQVYRYHFLKEAKVEGFLAPGAWHLAGLATAGLALTAAVALAVELGGAPGNLSARLRSRAVTGPAVVLGALLVGFVVATVAADGQGPLGLLWHDLGRFAEDKEFLRFFFFHPHLILAPAVATVALAASVGVRRMLRWGWTQPILPECGEAWRTTAVLVAGAGCMAAGATVELALLPESYTFYYVLLIPGLAVLLGLAGSWVAGAAAMLGCREELNKNAWTGNHHRPCMPAAHSPDHAGEARPDDRQSPRPCAGAAATATTMATAAAVVMFAYIPIGLEVGEKRFPHAPAGLSAAERAGLKPGTEVAGDLTCYDFKENVTTPFSELIRERLLPRCRFQGSMEPGMYHYLWKKKWYFSRAGEIAEVIRSTSEDGETITGSSLLAPLLALLSGRPMAADIVDTNTKRFKTGMIDRKRVEERCVDAAPEGLDGCVRMESERIFWEQVCRTKLRYIVAGPDSFFTPQRMMRHPLVRRHFQPELIANEPHLNMSGRYGIVLFRRVTEDPLPGEGWCSLEAQPD